MHSTNKKLFKADAYSPPTPAIFRTGHSGPPLLEWVYHLFKIFSHKRFKALPYFVNKNPSIAFYGSPQATELKIYINSHRQVSFEAVQCTVTRTGPQVSQLMTGRFNNH